MAEYARIIDRTTLQTPVHVYAHRDTDRVVSLIGTVPVGDDAYYQRLRGYIDLEEAEGAVVHCQGGPAVALRAAEPAGLSPDETHLFRQLRRAKNIADAAVAALGWTGQVQGLEYPQRWQTVDLPFIEIIRAVGKAVLLRQAGRIVRPLAVYNDPARALAWFRARTVIGLREMARGTPTPRMPGDGVLVEQRTEVALSGVDSTDRDLVLIWDAAYLPGLEAGLRERGFTRVGTDWYDVMRLPSARWVIWEATGRTHDAPTGTAADPIRPPTRPTPPREATTLDARRDTGATVEGDHRHLDSAAGQARCAGPWPW